MKRIKRIKTKEIPDKCISISKALIEVFLKEDNPSEAVALYLFYRQVAIWQKTYQVKATDKFCMTGLKLGWVKFFRAKKVLIKLGLIEQIQVGAKRGKFGQYYIKVHIINKWSPSDPMTIHESDNRSLKNRGAVKNRGVHSKNEVVRSSTSPVSQKPLSQNQRTNALKEHKILSLWKGDNPSDLPPEEKEEWRRSIPIKYRKLKLKKIETGEWQYLRDDGNYYNKLGRRWID
jgi:hypothetical protein